MAGLFDASRLYRALAEQGLLPTHSRTSRGLFDPDANRMAGKDPSTMAHEMTHAVQWNLLMNSAKAIQEKKRERKSISQQEEQFLEGMQKIYGEGFGRVSQENKTNTANANRVREAQLKDLYKSTGNRQYDSYRTSRGELEAFGVGDMTAKGVPLDVPPHLNPTMAQEFDVLFSLYNSLPQNVKAEFGQRRKEELNWLQQRGYRDKNLDALSFEPLLADPFAPTIK
jgi:hypothetical protein